MLQSVQLPFAMLPVLHFTASRERLGRFRSGRAWMALSVSLAVLVISINVILVIQFVEDFSPPAQAAVALYGCVYAFLCVSMVWDDFKALAAWASGGRFCASDGLGMNILERPSDFAMPASESWSTPSQPSIVRVSAPVPPGGI